MKKLFPLATALMLFGAVAAYAQTYDQQQQTPPAQEQTQTPTDQTTTTTDATTESTLPATASPLPLVGAGGLVALATGLWLSRRKP